MSAPKQIIAVRKDLKMPAGKWAAQVAHASMAVIMNHANHQEWHGDDNEFLKEFYELDVSTNKALSEWLSGAFTKICVWVNSEEELLSLYSSAQKAGILTSLIQDNGKTVFNGVPTYTTCAIGPAYPEELQPITGHLKLI